MQHSSTKTRWPLARRRARDDARCIACGKRIFTVEDTVAVQGEPFHAACALYSRRRR
jgi:hypothetical protein